MAMTPNTKKGIWVLAAFLFAIGSIKIHHFVKIELRQSGFTSVDRLGDIEVGSESPLFSTSDLQGEPVVLEDFQGRRVVILDFWATWCTPCLIAMPELQKLHEEYSGRGVEILAVNLGEGSKRIRDFMERSSYTFRVVEDRNSDVGKIFGVTAIPVQVVVGMDGRVEWIQAGYDPARMEELRQLLDRLVRDVPPLGSAAM